MSGIEIEIGLGILFVSLAVLYFCVIVCSTAGDLQSRSREMGAKDPSKYV